MTDDNRPPGREIRNAIYRMSMCRARLAHRHVYGIRCVRRLPASSLFLLAALGILFGSRSSWLLLGTLPRPPEVDEEALVVHLPAAEHGARHPSRRSEARAWGGRCSVPARTRRVWRRRSSPAPRRRASDLPAPARAASRPSRSSGPPRLPSRRRAGAHGARRQAGGAFSCRRRCSARPATPLGAQRDHPNLNPNPNPGPCPSPNPDPDPSPDPSPTVRWRRRGAGAAARSGVAQHAHRHACA